MIEPFDLTGLKTYDLLARPSKVFHEDLGRPVESDASLSDWLDSLPHQLAGNDVRRVSEQICRIRHAQGPVVAALGGHVIEAGCGPYLIDWVKRGLVTGVALTGAAAIHDFELALVGKSGEDVGEQVPEGKYGMARETADAFAVSARVGAENEMGLGYALGKYLASLDCPYASCSLVLAAYRAGIPCTIHVAMGADIVHMHPHVCGTALGEATMIDFRRLCSVVASMQDGMWLNLGSAVLLPQVFVNAVSVARNFGRALDGLIAVNVDKQTQYRPRGNVLESLAAHAIELIGHHEILLPLLHAAVACRLALAKPQTQAQAA
jgi:hypothetical protein